MEPNKWETNVKKTSNITLDKWQVNRLFKIQNIWIWITFGLKLFCHRLVCLTSLFLSVSPHSSCLSHLTLLVCLTSLFLSVSPHSSCLSHLTLLVCLTYSSCLSHLTLLVCLTSLFLSVSPHSSCLSHLTLLVCLTLLFLSVSLTLLVSQLDSLSSRDKLNLICDARLPFIRCAALSCRVQF